MNERDTCLEYFTSRVRERERERERRVCVCGGEGDEREMATRMQKFNVEAAHAEEEGEEVEEDATQLKFGDEFDSAETKMMFVTEVYDVLTASHKKKLKDTSNVPERFRKALHYAGRFQVCAREWVYRTDAHETIPPPHTHTQTHPETHSYERSISRQHIMCVSCV